MLARGTLVLLVAHGFLLIPQTTAAQTIGQKMADFCKANLGKQVGDGDCYDLAAQALKAAGAKPRFIFKDHPEKGDYVWGTLIYSREVEDGKPKETATVTQIQPGDVIQFRNARFQGRRPGGGKYSLTAKHHTAVVHEVRNKGTVVVVLHQNWGGKKLVTQSTFALGDLTSGWIRIDRAISR
jgi:hypothetical protein